MKVRKLSVCKEPILYQSVTKTSLSRYYTLCPCIKQYSFHHLIYRQRPVVRHFTNWWHLSHFPRTTAFTRTFATSIPWCYNFNGMKKWNDISCAILYIELQRIVQKWAKYCRLLKRTLMTCTAYVEPLSTLDDLREKPYKTGKKHECLSLQDFKLTGRHLLGASFCNKPEVKFMHSSINTKHYRK